MAMRDYPAHGTALRVWLPKGIMVYSTHPRHPAGGKPNGKSREVRCLPPSGWNMHGQRQHWSGSDRLTWVGQSGYWYWVLTKDVRRNQVLDEYDLEAA